MAISKGLVVVTGVSTGIGLSIAKVLLARGFEVWGSVRKQADAERLQRELGEGFHALLMDVTDTAAIARGAKLVADRLGKTPLVGLVNNAGIAWPGPLMHQPLDEIRQQFEVNLMGPLAVTQAFVPLLRSKAGTPGRVVNISSTGGSIGVPFLGAYVASKHALNGLSESLRRELQMFGIDVIVVAPGSVATPIWDKGEAMDFSPYAKTEFAGVLERFRTFLVADGRKGLQPEAIGEAVAKVLTVKKPKVFYAVVPQRFKNWTMPRLLPRRVVDKLIAKQIGMERI